MNPTTALYTNSKSIYPNKNIVKLKVIHPFILREATYRSKTEEKGLDSRINLTGMYGMKKFRKTPTMQFSLV